MKPALRPAETLPSDRGWRSAAAVARIPKDPAPGQPDCAGSQARASVRTRTLECSRQVQLVQQVRRVRQAKGMSYRWPPSKSEYDRCGWGPHRRKESAAAGHRQELSTTGAGGDPTGERNEPALVTVKKVSTTGAGGGPRLAKGMNWRWPPSKSEYDRCGWDATGEKSDLPLVIVIKGARQVQVGRGGQADAGQPSRPRV